MKDVADAFWRAAVYCLHPRVVVLSLLPLGIMVTLSLGLGYFFWNDAVDVVRVQLDTFQLVTLFGEWLAGLGLDGLRAVLAPALLLFVMIPFIVIVSLLFVAMLMTPAMVRLVSERRFAHLEQKKGGSWWASLLWSLGSTVLASVVLLLSLPLWLIPPLVLILPPLIWGWLTYRVMAYDALADHASADERRELFMRYRGPLLGIGILSGYLGAVPSLLWASGAMFIAMAPIVVPIAIWIYTLVFAFSSLWFAHYALAMLAKLRHSTEPAPPLASAEQGTPAGGGVKLSGSGGADAPVSMPPP